MACGNIQYFKDNFTKFFKKISKGLASGKEVQFWLNAVLLLLRGKYLPPRSPWKPEKSREKDVKYPYAFLPFSYLEGEMNKYLTTVVEAIFKKGKSIMNGEEYLEQLVQILLQVSAHSLKYVVTLLLPSLYSDKHPFNSLIAIIVTKRILDKESGFWKNAGCTVKTDNEENTSKIDLNTYGLTYEKTREYLEPLVLTLLMSCDSSVGLDQMGCLEEILMNTTHLPKSFVLSSVEGDDTLQLAKVISSIERWKSIIKRSQNVHSTKLFQKNDNKIQEMVLEWLKSGKVSSVGSKKTQEAIFNLILKKDRKPQEISPEQKRSILVFKESVRAIPFVKFFFYLFPYFYFA